MYFYPPLYRHPMCTEDTFSTLERLCSQLALDGLLFDLFLHQAKRKVLLTQVTAPPQSHRLPAKDPSSSFPNKIPCYFPRQISPPRFPSSLQIINLSSVHHKPPIATHSQPKVPILTPPSTPPILPVLPYPPGQTSHRHVLPAESSHTYPAKHPANSPCPSLPARLPTLSPAKSPLPSSNPNFTIIRFNNPYTPHHFIPSPLPQSFPHLHKLFLYHLSLSSPYTTPELTKPQCTQYHT